MRSGLRSFAAAALATIAYGAVHSALASRHAKDAVARRIGQRHRDGLYRAFYNAQSVATFTVLGTYLLSLPREEVYHVRGPAAAAMRAGQAGGLVWAFLAARAVGIGPITGWASFRAWVRGASPLPEPEAQGPAPDVDGTIRVEGPFRFSRHPLNLAPLPVIWLQPVMTTRWLGFNAVATVYLILGSVHEEQRMEAAYGPPYRRYIRGGPPFFFPVRPGSRPGLPPARPC